MDNLILCEGLKQLQQLQLQPRGPHGLWSDGLWAHDVWPRGPWLTVIACGPIECGYLPEVLAHCEDLKGAVGSPVDP